MRRKTQDDFDVLMAALAAMVQNFVMTPEVMKVYAKLLEPMGWEAVCGALETIIADRNSRDPFPSVKEIKEKITPTASPEVQAQHIAGLINQAIAKVGPYRTADFRAFVGELGWKVVQMAGGIESVCAVTDREIGTQRAQWKQMALAEMKFEEIRGRQGGPAIEHKGEEGLKSLGSLLKEIEHKKERDDDSSP